MAAPTFGSIGTRLGTTTSTPNIAVPTSVDIDDIVVAFIWVVGAITITGRPSGFAAAEGSPATAQSSSSLHVEWKRATDADVGTYGFTLSSSNFVYARAARYLSCLAAGDPWDTPTDEADAANTSAGPGFLPGVSITTADTDRLLVYAAANIDGDGNTWSAPFGFTQREGGVSVTNFHVSDRTQGPIGSSGTVQAAIDIGSSNPAVSWLGALKPIAEAAPTGVASRIVVTGRRHV